MWDPFLVYTDKLTEALDEVLAIKCREASSDSRLIHAFHVLFWPEYPYLSIHTTVCFHTFKKLKLKKKMQSLLLSLNVTDTNYYMVYQIVGCDQPWGSTYIS
jgi:hypothetical protein